MFFFSFCFSVFLSVFLRMINWICVFSQKQNSLIYQSEQSKKQNKHKDKHKDIQPKKTNISKQTQIKHNLKKQT